MLKMATLPFFKQTNKLISCLLVVAILLSTVISSMVFVFADDSKSTGYTVTSTTCGTNDKTVDSENNLINGISNIEYQDNDITEKQYTDGNVDKATPYASLKLSFPLTYSSTISRVIVTSRNGHSGKATRLAEYDIYIADSYEELYNEGNKVASFSTDSTSTGYYLAIDTFEFVEGYAKGKYIGFNITKGSMGGDTGKQYIAEIEVFGEKLPYTVTSTTCKTSEKTVDKSNLIYDITPVGYDNITKITDGIGDNETPYNLSELSFQFEKISTVSKVIVTGKNNSNNKGATRPAAYDIYIADSLDELYNKENRVASFSTVSTNASFHLTVDTFESVADYAKTGKYIGFKFTKKNNTENYDNICIAEIEVLGEEYIPSWTVTSDTCTPDDKTVDTKNNLINGISNVENPNITQYTDGDGKNGTPRGILKLSFPLTNVSTISKVMVTSKNGYTIDNKQVASRLAEYDIYIADSLDDLYNAENKVASFSTDSDNNGYHLATDTFEFSEDYAKTGKYIGFNITKGSNGGETGKQYITEIEVFGTEHISDWTVTSTTCDPNEKTVDTSNLIYQITPDGYDITTFTDGNGKNETPYGISELSFPFESTSTVSKVIVTGKNASNGKGATRPAAYDIYIADSLEELYNEANKVASFSTDSTDKGYYLTIDTFEFSESYAKTGNYIGFKFTKKNNANLADFDKICIAEIEVFGTSEGGSSGGVVLGTRPEFVEANKNLTYTTGETTVSGGRSFYNNITLYEEAHTNQYVALDYVFEENGARPVVWAKAICSTQSNASVTGYYVCMDGWATKLYKRTSDGVDTYIGVCGQHTDYAGRNVRLEIVTEQVGSSTKITVTTYKSTTDGTNRYRLMLKNTYFDDTAELQTPGYAGYAVKGIGKTAKIKGFNYSSSDGTADSLTYIENPVTEKANGIAGQKVIIDPSKTYVLSARVSLTNTNLALYYWTAQGKMEQAFVAVGTISKVDGYRTITYEFCLNDLISQNELSAYSADKYGYDSMAEVFVGFATDKSKVLSYSNLTLAAKGSSDNILVNGDLKMGLLGYSDEIQYSKWAFDVSGFGDTTSYNKRLVLKTNVSQSDYDAIFKMGANESTGIDYSKYDKLMLHLTADGSNYVAFGQMFSLEPGETYVYEVDFGFDPRNSAHPLIFYHTVKDEEITYEATKRKEPNYKLTADGCRYTYEFTVPSDAYVNPATGKVTIFAGLSTGQQGRDCYLCNFDLYKKSDASKTNLFLNPDFKDGFKNWIVNNNYYWKYISSVAIKTYNQPGKGVELLPYDASKFTLNDGTLSVPDIPDFDYANYKGKYMICIPETVSQTYGKLGQILEFEKGTTYNFTMLYKYIRQNSTKPLVSYFTDDPYASDEYIISKGYTNKSGNIDRAAYWAAIRKTVSTEVVMDDLNCKQTVTFKVPSDAWKNSSGKAPMFVGISTGEYETLCYFADLCVSKEGSTVNMFKNADFKEGFNNWIAVYGWVLDPPIQGEGIFWTSDYVIAQILPYDESIFVNDTNDALWNDGDWFSIFGEDDVITSLDKYTPISSSDDSTKTVTVRGKLNIPATIALYGGITVVLAAGGVVSVILLKKKRKKQHN